jgi:hypothetical protein
MSNGYSSVDITLMRLEFRKRETWMTIVRSVSQGTVPGHLASARSIREMKVSCTAVMISQTGGRLRAGALSEAERCDDLY